MSYRFWKIFFCQIYFTLIKRFRSIHRNRRKKKKDITMKENKLLGSEWKQAEMLWKLILLNPYPLYFPNRGRFATVFTAYRLWSCYFEQYNLTLLSPQQFLCDYILFYLKVLFYVSNKNTFSFLEIRVSSYTMHIKYTVLNWNIFNIDSFF